MNRAYMMSLSIIIGLLAFISLLLILLIVEPLMQTGAAISVDPCVTPSDTPVCIYPTNTPTETLTATATYTPTVEATFTPTATPTPTSVPTFTPTPSPTPVIATGSYLIIDESRLISLPTYGSAWDYLKYSADAGAGTPNLCDQNNRLHPGTTLAAALVYARTGVQSYKDKAKSLILAAYPTQVYGCGNAVLSLGRQLGAYVIAADLIRLDDPGFNTWLSDIRDADIGGHSRWYSLRLTSTDAAGNWSTFALASLIAADRFLNDTTMLAQDWQIFSAYGVPHGYPFNKTASYQEIWSCIATDSTGKLPIAINTPCTKSGYNIDGAPVEDASRTTFPSVGNYPAESAQGYVIQALLLDRAGYPAWSVNDNQVERVALFRERYNNLNYSSADYYVQWMINYFYGLNQPTKPGYYGRVFGYADWLFAKP